MSWLKARSSWIILYYEFHRSMIAENGSMVGGALIAEHWSDLVVIERSYQWLLWIQDTLLQNAAVIYCRTVFSWELAFSLAKTSSLPLFSAHIKSVLHLHSTLLVRINKEIFHFQNFLFIKGSFIFLCSLQNPC